MSDVSGSRRLSTSFVLALGLTLASAVSPRSAVENLDPITLRGPSAVFGPSAIFGPSLLIGPSRASAQCIDEAIRDELNARRRYRGVRERLFQKAGRFEVSVMGGVYAADLLSASYLVQGAITYHVSEEIGLEASFAYSRAESALVRLIEQDRGISLIRVDAPVFVYQAHLIWALAYGKVRWFGAEIGRLEFNVALGGGITDNQTSRELTGSFSVNVRFFFEK